MCNPDHFLRRIESFDNVLIHLAQLSEAEIMHFAAQL